MKQLKLYIYILSTKTVLTVLTVQGVITMLVSGRKFGPFIQKESHKRSEKRSEKRWRGYDPW